MPCDCAKERTLLLLLRLLDEMECENDRAVINGLIQRVKTSAWADLDRDLFSI